LFGGQPKPETRSIQRYSQPLFLSFPDENRRCFTARNLVTSAALAAMVRPGHANREFLRFFWQLVNSAGWSLPVLFGLIYVQVPMSNSLK